MKTISNIINGELVVTKNNLPIVHKSNALLIFHPVSQDEARSFLADNKTTFSGLFTEHNLSSTQFQLDMTEYYIVVNNYVDREEEKITTDFYVVFVYGNGNLEAYANGSNGWVKSKRRSDSSNILATSRVKDILKSNHLDPSKIFVPAEYTDAKLIKTWVKGTFEIIEGICNVQGDVKIRNFHKDSLPIQFGYISGDFDCQGNMLKYSINFPRQVKGDFNCGDNQLTEILNGPLFVGADYDCYNNKLTNLKGVIEKVDGNFACMENYLETLDDGPYSVKKNYYCADNEKDFTEEYVRTVCHVSGKVFVK